MATASVKTGSSTRPKKTAMPRRRDAITDDSSGEAELYGLPGEPRCEEVCGGCRDRKQAEQQRTPGESAQLQAKGGTRACCVYADPHRQPDQEHGEQHEAEITDGDQRNARSGASTKGSG